MKTKRALERPQKARKKTVLRASISFPPNLYGALETIARQKRVSLAWVVRDAAVKYTTDKFPLVKKTEGRSK